MASYNILVLPGDGVGPEIIPEALKVLDLISSHTGTKFAYTTALMGGCSIDKHGVALTDEVLQLAKKSDAVLFGSVGGPKWYVILLFF
jgi:3-isopropylmalate dehydrogenase